METNSFDFSGSHIAMILEPLQNTVKNIQNQIERLSIAIGSAVHKKSLPVKKLTETMRRFQMSKRREHCLIYSENMF